MQDLLKNLSALMRATTTYRIGLLQAKVYRQLKARTAEALGPLGISTIEWAFLGLLHDAPVGMRAAAAAHELGVEAPFITVLIKKLSKKGLVRTQQDPKDSRAKLLCLTPAGRRFIKTTEARMRAVMRPVADGISPQELMAYVAVLETISNNCEK